MSLVLALGVAFALIIVKFSAAAPGGFEIDADQSAVGNSATFSHALFSGNDSNGVGDDWAQGGSGHGVFLPSASTATSGTAATNCYGSNVDKNPAITGVSTFVCDGNSDPKFRTIQPEETQVQGGKQTDASWNVKPGQVKPKNDFSHAYAYGSLEDSPCDTNHATADDIVLKLAGHVGDNEGDHFWGFEFDQTPPDNFSSLKSGNASGSTFNLVFHRQIGDFLVSFTVPGSTSSPVILEIYTVTGFNSDGSAIFTLKGAVPGCPNTAPQGLTKLATNDFADATAPPWNVPACDPTSDNSANTCRLVKGAYTDPSHQLLPPRDFAEASIDLRAFGINPCVNTFIFTSRSSHDLSSSLDDVGGGDFNLCGNISGTKFQDTNADGVRGTATAEPGLANWPIYLYQDTDGNGTLSSSEYSGQPTGFPLTTTTASDGSYTFHSVSSGNYIICEAKTAPSGLGTGWIQSDPANTKCQAGDFNGASPLLADGGYAVTMMGLDVTGKDFGNYQNGSISGTKFKDANADGVKGSTEAGLGGWSIKLFADTDGNGTLSSTEAATAAATTTTANDGTYSFPAVKPGTYIVCEVLDNGALQTHVGWVQSYPLSTTVGSASCAGSSTLGARGWNVTVTSGSSTTAQDIGNTPLSNITVTFNPLAKLPDGTTAATKATSMSCVDKNSSSVGSNSNSNSLTTSNVKNNQSSVVCTVTFTDP